MPQRVDPRSQSAEAVGGGRALRLVYLCLQATIEGQASHAHVHEIIAGLRRRGWHVRLYQPSYASGQRAPGALARLFEFLNVQLRLLPSLRSADVVYIRWHFATFPGAAAAWLLGKRVVQEVNGNFEDVYAAWPTMRRFKRLLTLVQRLQLRIASGIVVVTPQLASWVHGEGSKARVVVIPNAANATLFNPGASTDIELPRPYVAFVGEFAAWQGVPTMLAAAEHPSWPSGVHLVIVGGGAGEIAAESAAIRNPRLTYVGRLPYRSVPGVLAGSLAALSPKGGGGAVLATGVNPLKVYEAMACGTPVIVSAYPGQADLVESTGAGLVVAPEQPGDLAAAVAWLWSHPEERATMGARGRRAVEVGHTWDHRAADTDRFLRATIGGEPSP